jgi:hypothetical protein
MTSPSEQQVVRTRCKATRSVGCLLEELRSEELAKKTNAQRRKARKCTTTQLLVSFWELCGKRAGSYDSWAIKVGRAIGGPITGMAICKRMSSEMIHFLKELLAAAFAIRSEPLFLPDLFGAFKDVLLQDASHFSLPDGLAVHFPGSHSRTGNVATAKVQAVLSLTQGSLVDLQLGCFRDNDQGDATRIVHMVEKGVLVIRDLGYFTIDAFNAIANSDAFFLSRFKGNVSVFDGNGSGIDLLRYLKRHGGMDQEVIIGNKKQLRCRMVAIALPAPQVAQRLRKAKADRSAKTNHSKAYYDLLKYSIYITNVDGKTWSTLQVAQAYRCRWFIEILFKSWKTGLGLDFNLAGRYADKLRVEYYLYARMLQMVLLVMPTYRAVTLIAKRKDRTISIVKLSSYIQEEIHAFVRAKDLQLLLEKAAYHCVYELRKRRANSIEILLGLSP